MNESESKKTTSTQDNNDTTVAEISVDAMRGVFRLLFAGDNSLSELYAGTVVVNPKDISELNDKIIDKLRHYETHGLAFSAVASYENSRSQEYGSWERFCDDDWTSPDVLDSLSIWWKFLIRFPDSHKPVLIVLTCVFRPQ